MVADKYLVRKLSILSNQPPFAGILLENFMIIFLLLPGRAHTGRPGDLAPTVHFEGGKAVIPQFPSPDRGELDTGNGLSYQLCSTEDCTISRGQTLSGLQSPARVPESSPLSREGGRCPSARLSAEDAVC